MSKKLEFNFDMKEVFEGIEKGAVKQLSEMEFESIVNNGKREFQNRLEEELKTNYIDVRTIKEEVVNKAVGNLIEKLKESTQEQFISQITREVSSTLKSYRIADKMEDIIDRVENRLVTLALSKKPKVTITKEEYEKLQKNNMILQALENGGVDNWDGYSYSIQKMEEEYKEFRKMMSD